MATGHTNPGQHVSPRTWDDPIDTAALDAARTEQPVWTNEHCAMVCHDLANDGAITMDEPDGCDAARCCGLNESMNAAEDAGDCSCHDMNPDQDLRGDEQPYPRGGSLTKRQC